MKPKNILIVFFIACIITFLIYKKYDNKETNILILGDNYLLSLTDKNYLFYLNKIYKNINSNFVYDYKENYDLQFDIENNKYIIIKNQKVFLNQEIRKSNIIILNIDNYKYMPICKKNNRLITERDEKEYLRIKKIIDYIKKISNAKIIILGNFCNNFNRNQTKNKSKLYKNYNYVNIDELNDKSNLEYYTYEKIIKYLIFKLEECIILNEVISIT